MAGSMGAAAADFSAYGASGAAVNEVTILIINI
jgi:hypothetical protein